MKTKVKSICCAIAGGYEKTFEVLDRELAKIKEKKIHDVKDKFYPALDKNSNRYSAHVVRVVIYE